MLTPATLDFTAYTDGTFDPIFTFWADPAFTEAFDLTGYTVEFEIVRPVSLMLTAGSGLTITAAAGVVAVELTPEQTGAVAVVTQRGTTAHYYMKLTDGSGEVSYPIHGTITFANP